MPIFDKLTDELAHSDSINMEMEDKAQKLLAGGKDALDDIVSYLYRCGNGSQSEYWWNNASNIHIYSNNK